MLLLLGIQLDISYIFNIRDNNSSDSRLSMFPCSLLPNASGLYTNPQLNRVSHAIRHISSTVTELSRTVIVLSSRFLFLGNITFKYLLVVGVI